MSDIKLPEITAIKTQEIFDETCSIVRNTYKNIIEIRDEDPLLEIKENLSPNLINHEETQNGGQEFQNGSKLESDFGKSGNFNGVKISLLSKDDVQYQCLECGLSLKCKFLVHNFRNKISYICGDICWYAFSQKNGFQVNRLSILNKNLGTNTKTSLINYNSNGNNLVSTNRLLIRKCVECLRALVDPRFNSDVLSWEIMEFCDEECLEEYQKRNCSICDLCKNEILKNNYGKFSLKISNLFKHFCGVKCLNIYKTQHNICFFCYENLNLDAQIYLGSTGKFCSIACFAKYDQVFNVGAKNIYTEGLCTKCKKNTTLHITFENCDVVFKFCTKTCFDHYKYENKLEPSKCTNCKTFFINRNQKFLGYNQTSDTPNQTFCSNICKTMFFSKDKLILPCSWCKTVKYNYDMIKKNINNKQVSTCTLKCLNLYQKTLKIFEKTKKECQLCLNNFNNKFHVTMWDNTIYSFCSRYCVDNYMKQLTQQSFPDNLTPFTIGYQKIVPKGQNVAKDPITKLPNQATRNFDINIYRNSSDYIPQNTVESTQTNLQLLGSKGPPQISFPKTSDGTSNPKTSTPTNFDLEVQNLVSNNSKTIRTYSVPQNFVPLLSSSATKTPVVITKTVPQSSIFKNLIANNSRKTQILPGVQQGSVGQNATETRSPLVQNIPLSSNPNWQSLGLNGSGNIQENPSRDPFVPKSTSPSSLLRNISSNIQSIHVPSNPNWQSLGLSGSGNIQEKHSSNPFVPKSTAPSSLYQNISSNKIEHNQVVDINKFDPLSPTLESSNSQISIPKDSNVVPSTANSSTQADEPPKTKLRREIYLLPRKHPKMANKMTICKPFLTNFTQNYPEECSQKVNESTQTDFPEVVVPIPLPFYVPIPLLVGQTPVPIPFPVPIPIPVPIFLPMKQNSAKEILKEIHRIQETMPDDPLEAELVHMAAFHEENQHKSSEIAMEHNLEEPQLNLEETKPVEVEQKLLDFEGASDSEEEDLPLSERLGRWKHEIKILKIEKIKPDGLETCFETPRSKRKHKNDLEIELAKSSIDKDVPKRLSKRLRKHQEQESSSNEPKLEGTTSNLKVSYGVNAWYFWFQLKYRGTPFEAKNILDLTPEELSSCLSEFVVEIRKPNGQEYFPDTIFYLCLCIQKFLVENGKKDNIFVDDFYKKFIKTFDQVSTKFALLHEPSQFVITRVEEQHLWESHQLGIFSPKSLLFTLIYLNTINFKLDTLPKHLELSFGRMVRGNKNNTPLLRFYPPTSNKTSSNRRKYSEVFQNHRHPERCPLEIFDFYISKCPDIVKKTTTFLYLVPEKYCTKESPVWFSNQPMDKDELDLVLRRIKMVKEVNMVSFVS